MAFSKRSEGISFEVALHPSGWRWRSAAWPRPRGQNTPRRLQGDLAVAVDFTDHNHIAHNNMARSDHKVSSSLPVSRVARLSPGQSAEIEIFDGSTIILFWRQQRTPAPPGGNRGGLPERCARERERADSCIPERLDGATGRSALITGNVFRQQTQTTGVRWTCGSPETLRHKSTSAVPMTSTSRRLIDTVVAKLPAGRPKARHVM